MTRRERILAALVQLEVPVTVSPFIGDGRSVRGDCHAETVIPLLVRDPRWQLQAIRSACHADLGPLRVEFRSYMGKLGTGVRGYFRSMQFIVRPAQNLWYADLDWANPEESVVGAVVHGAQCLTEGAARVWRKLKGGSV